MITDRQLAAQGRAMQREAWGMDGRKEAIISALRSFVEQRPGFDLGNYATMRDYRQDQRRAQRQLHDARELLRAVEACNDISADDLLKAADGGRLVIAVATVQGEFRIDYCAGQYWCTEFRAGVCRVLASALWDWQREHMLAPIGPPEDHRYCMIPPGHKSPTAMSAGDWLRATFRQRFGKGLQSRWFD